jgi:hypothetical protein
LTWLTFNRREDVDCNVLRLAGDCPVSQVPGERSQGCAARQKRGVGGCHAKAQSPQISERRLDRRRLSNDRRPSAVVPGNRACEWRSAEDDVKEGCQPVQTHNQKTHNQKTHNQKTVAATPAASTTAAAAAATPAAATAAAAVPLN